MAKAATMEEVAGTAEDREVTREAAREVAEEVAEEVDNNMMVTQ